MSNKKGFSGLDDLSTDIDDIISENHKEFKNNSEQKTEYKEHKTTSNDNETENIEKSKSTSSTTSNTSNIESNDSNKGSSSWIWWLIAVGVIGWIIIQSNSTSSSSNKTSYSSSQQNYSSSAKSNNYSKSTTDDYYESKPDAYLTTLNKNQLLYCEAEKIRLDAAQNKIDLYSTYEVDKFNALTNDYNSRCANKQYYKNDMYYVDINIEKKRYQLQQDGLARFPKSNSISSNSQSYNSNQPKNQTPNVNSKILYSLTINTIPSDAKVKIVNINPKYQNGIKLEKGNYHIEVSKDGYETIKQWILLDKDIIYSIKLQNTTKYNLSNNDNNSLNKNTTKKSSNKVIPENAQMNYFGNDWECKRGYSKNINECIKIQIPANAELNYFGDNWQCKRGYSKNGNECIKGNY